ncbi:MULTISPECIES: hypothetical protein [Photorhabdus]|uniref:Penicillin-binding protein n=1 Tax=Photorhabdus thracensis TaxID=230089 RepID=A0A0F7LTJ9_9GAMM|nr:hypothetical protein [Photorhabdus thracensis]AKH65213.1 hypothetical protein VY86_19515 [Photorhabdus thracensis]
MPPLRVTFIPYNSLEDVDDVINNYINENPDVWDEPENNFGIITIIYNGDLTEHELENEVEGILEASVVVEPI